MPAAEQAPKASRATNVKVPGQTSAPAATEQAEPQTAAFDPDADEQLIAGAGGFDDGAAAAPVDDSPVLTLTQAQLDAAIARAIAQASANQRAAVAATKADPMANLPDEKDIVLDEIKGRSVLTKQGYVVHPDYGRPAAHLQQLAQG